SRWWSFRPHLSDWRSPRRGADGERQAKVRRKPSWPVRTWSLSSWCAGPPRLLSLACGGEWGGGAPCQGVDDQDSTGFAWFTGFVTMNRCAHDVREREGEHHSGKSTSGTKIYPNGPFPALPRRFPPQLARER